MSTPDSDQNGDRRPNQNQSNDQKGQTGGKPGPTKQPGSRGPFGVLLVLSFIVLFIIAFNSMSPKPEQVETWNEFVSLYDDGSIEDVHVGTGAISAEKKGSEGDRVSFTINPTTREYWLPRVEALTGGEFSEEGGPAWWQQLLFSPLLFMMLLILLLWFFIFRGLRSAASGGGMLGSFGKSRHKVMSKESTGVTFKDVAGVDESKEELVEVVEFLKNPKRFMRLGGKVPRGVLLHGQPGCGKTLLAKAIAGEADVPFFTISGSDFVEMFVGVGASRVRDLFKQAKESAPCIIFLDEIDAVGRKRGGGFSSGGNDEREQTLNAILVEMDGFESADQVIVIASTNRPDVLDPALTRPGRFDRHVAVSLPDVKGRREILGVHSKKVKLGPDVDFDRIARGTPMFSGAELAAIINEAAIIAVMADKDFVEHADLEEARDKVRYGRQRKSRVIEEKERIATAYHEAGHAVLQALLQDADPLHKVTIIPRGQAMGATFSLPEKDRYGFGLKWMTDTMRVVCGGRIAEKRKTDDVTSGAAMDIQQLTTMARSMVLDWGMSEKLGFVRYSSDQQEMLVESRAYSEETATIIDEEIRSYADAAYRDAERMLDENWEKVVAVAEALLKYETLDADEVHALMRGESIGRASMIDMLAAEREKQSRDAESKPSETPAEDGNEEFGGGAVPSPA